MHYQVSRILEEIHTLRKDNIQIIELVPLRRVDVYYAATELGIDADKFMNEIWEKEVIPLAIKPITLKFLFNLYIRQGSFPSTQKELYMKGCELLCEETNESRVASRNTGSMRAKDRLKVASRIAALMVFSNKYAVKLETCQRKGGMLSKHVECCPERLINKIRGACPSF
ncbi:hypothetical protein [Paenibacillus dokdonensis]|uniref:hypothetical protein n=1 Tax=Paenibacillus dokdonensis TaxID=2567944 RepID=UPI0010A8BFFE|nr:hypothetical protein [Paenibacillus dokdonensis]